MKPNERLRQAREAAKKTIDEVENASGVYCYDLETYEHDISLFPMSKLHKVTVAIGTTIRSLFSVYSDVTMDFQGLAERLQQYLKINGLSLEQFEQQAGWGLGEFLNRPDVAWEWCVDCLRDVCTEMGVNWLDVLPT